MMLVGHNWFLPEKPPAGQHYERWFYADGKGDERNRLYRENADDTKGAAQTWHSKLPVEWHNSTWTADRAIDWLSNTGTRKPFCSWVSFPDPHHPFDCPLPWSKLHAPEDVDLPPHRTRDFDKRPWWHEAVLSSEPAGEKKHAEIRKQYSRIQPQSDEQLREIIANTYGQIALIDHNVGRLMKALEDNGLAENTIVIYMSDHGDWLGDHGLVLKGPMHYEGLLRVPLIVRGPGIVANAVVEEPVSTLDIGPTLYDYANCEASLTQHGTSLRRLLEGEQEIRECARSEWELLPTRAGVALSLRVVRTKTHKLTMDLESGTGELYDLVEDPHELHDRFNDPAYAGVRSELEELISKRPKDERGLNTQVGLA